MTLLRPAVLRWVAPRSRGPAVRRMSTVLQAPQGFANHATLYDSIMHIYAENQLLSNYSGVMIGIVVLQRLADAMFDLRPLFLPLRKLLAPPNESNGERSALVSSVAGSVPLIRADSAAKPEAAVKTASAVTVEVIPAAATKLAAKAGMQMKPESKWWLLRPGKWEWLRKAQQVWAQGLWLLQRHIFEPLRMRLKMR